MRLGTPAVVRLGFDDHGLGNLINHCFNPHTDSRIRTPQKCVVQLRFVWWWSSHHNSQNSSPIPPDAAGNCPAASGKTLHKVEVVLELGKQIALAFEEA